MIIGKMPTVPEYYQDFIDSSVDLVANPKQCCPFHQERTPSFSYDIKTGRWTCFGKCKAHGDVIEMHRRLHHYATKEEADHDLKIRYNIPKEDPRDVMLRAARTPLVSINEVNDNVTYTKAVALAGNNPDRWLQLDYVMSKHPYNRNDVLELINEWSYQ